MPTRLAVLGDHDPAKPTHRELDAALSLLPSDVEASWIATDSDTAKDLSDFDALWVVPGGPYADDSAVYAAIRSAREDQQPFLGTCSGFQYAVVEFASNVAGMKDAAHAEASPEADEPVIEPLACSLSISNVRSVPSLAPGLPAFAALNRSSDRIGATSDWRISSWIGWSMPV